MSAVTLGDVRQAAIILGMNVSDEASRMKAAEQFAALFRARFYTFDTAEFLSLVERVHDCPQDYEPVPQPKREDGSS